MKLTFLGTGTSTGVPVMGCDCDTCRSSDPRDNRMRTSALIEFEESGTTFLIDAGPDFRQQMLRSGTRRVDAILLTHHHYDHVGGLDDVRGLNYSMHADVKIYGPQCATKAVFHNLDYVFEQKPYPGVPRMNVTTIGAEPFEINGIGITPLPITHGSLAIFGYRIGPLAYITDASSIPPQTMQLLRGTETLIINALGPFEHHSHLSINQAIAIACEVSARQTYFTHIGHKMGRHAITCPTLPQGMSLAYDGLTIKI